MNLLGFLNTLRFARFREVLLKYVTTPADTLRKIFIAHKPNIEKLIGEEPVIEPQK